MHDVEKEKIIYSIQFFYNLPSINSRMMHARQRKKRSFIAFNSFATDHLYKFQNEAWQIEKEKMCWDHFIQHSILHHQSPINFRMMHNKEIKDLLRSIVFHNLPAMNFRMRHDKEKMCRDQVSYVTFNSMITYRVCRL